VSRVFVDTSGLLALLLREDRGHERAARAFARLQDDQATLVTTSYVLVETYALLGRRVGLDAVRAFRDDFAPVLDVVWVDAQVHERGLDLVLERRDRAVSLVDAVSFVVMRDQAIEQALALDRHFAAAGFALVA
jgi:predicted nucleic acid-binding protein